MSLVMTSNFCEVSLFCARIESVELDTELDKSEICVVMLFALSDRVSWIFWIRPTLIRSSWLLMFSVYGCWND